MSESLIEIITKNRKKILLGFLYVIVIVTIAFIINAFLYSPVLVSGNSMNPALSDKDVVIVSKCAYSGSEPERFDMILFPDKYDKSIKLIKRVIGLPGDTVEIIDDNIYINGERLYEFYGIYDSNATDIVLHLMGNYGPVTLGDDEYFVLGDNRYISDDSRSSDVGLVNGGDIIGKVCFRLWPFNAIGSLDCQ